MAENTLIEWAHHTFNPWRGCAKVSAGCKFCYAESWASRFGSRFGGWGPNGRRVVAADSRWWEPFVWNRKAQVAGERHRVFSSSLADVFEAPDTMPAASVMDVRRARLRLMTLIQATPALDWLLLTKRPGRVVELLADLRDATDLDMTGRTRESLRAWIAGEPPANVWMGTSVEDQATADERIADLLRIPARVRFLSMEPLLTPVDIRPYLADFELGLGSGRGNLHWVIVGGESGPQARPMHPDWARSIRDQCRAAGVPFLFKQWGEWTPWPGFDPAGKGRPVRAVFPDGSDLLDLTGRGTNGEGSARMARVGKKAAGRILDGAIHDEFPEPTGVPA